MIKDSTIFNKNQLLEFLQQEYRFNPTIESEYDRKGPDNDLIWIAKNPKIFDPNKKLMYELTGLTSIESKSKQKAEQDLYLKIYKKLKKEL